MKGRRRVYCPTGVSGREARGGIDLSKDDDLRNRRLTDACLAELRPTLFVTGLAVPAFARRFRAILRGDLRGLDPRATYGNRRFGATLVGVGNLPARRRRRSEPLPAGRSGRSSSAKTKLEDS